ncbi:MAG: metal-dependent hydrolase [Chloroflexota bacterium]
MQTYSHAIINATLGKQLEKRGVRPMYWALVLGSLMPDAPLTVLTLNYWYNIRAELGAGASPEQLFGERYDALYFGDPVWITSHALMHAPLMIALWLLIGWFSGFRQGKTWGKWVFWFAVGNALHSLLDIPTHAGDGPLLLYPFNWSLRYDSPVSYWDPQRYGTIFAPLEHLLDVLLIGYLVFDGIIKPRREKRKNKQAEAAAVGD